MSKLLTFFLVISITHVAFAKNMKVVDPGDGKFSVVRTGIPKFKEFQKMCEMGIRRMFVMAGNGSIEEEFAKTEWAQKNCAGFKVEYNCKQATKTPLSTEFLNKFDQAVADAKASGYGVAFRCNCGCHRTGRLAAYYRMKYLEKSPADSVKDQRKNAPGLATFLHRKVLKKQIHALNDYIKTGSCNPASKEYNQEHCIIEKDTSCESPAVNDPDDADVEEVTKGESTPAVPAGTPEPARIPAADLQKAKAY